MPKHREREKPLKRRGKRYEIFVDNQDGELEYLTLTQLIDLAEAPPTDIPRDQLTGLACRIYDSRRVRGRFFHNSMLGEPVWDMLLALYCLPSRGRHPSVTGLCHAAGVALTTGLRWVRLMEQKGLIVRRPDLRDGRRAYLMLSDRGEELMNAYVRDLSRPDDTLGWTGAHATAARDAVKNCARSSSGGRMSTALALRRAL